MTSKQLFVFIDKQKIDGSFCVQSYVLDIIKKYDVNHVEDSEYIQLLSKEQLDKEIAEFMEDELSVVSDVSNGPTNYSIKHIDFDETTESEQPTETTKPEKSAETTQTTEQQSDIITQYCSHFYEHFRIDENGNLLVPYDKNWFWDSDDGITIEPYLGEIDDEKEQMCLVSNVFSLESNTFKSWFEPEKYYGYIVDGVMERLENMDQIKKMFEKNIDMCYATFSFELVKIYPAMTNSFATTLASDSA